MEGRYNVASGYWPRPGGDGENLVLNMEKGVHGGGVQPDGIEVDDFVNGRAKGKKVVGCHSIGVLQGLKRRGK